LLDAYYQRFLNVHLGLSPYYRGSGTNFWPLVHGEFEYVGATFMHLDRGIDTGEIIHQIRARIFPGDTPHQIGNRLIADMVCTYAEIIRRAHQLAPAPQPAPLPGKVFRNKDFCEDATRQLYQRFSNGAVDAYLAVQEDRRRAAPIIEHPALRAGGGPH
jgi:hypothetical protein